MTEAELQNRIRLLSRGPVRLFRNNVGTGWSGAATRITAANAFTIGQTLRPGDVVVRQSRPLHAGLATGSGDLIGWRSQLIGPEHLGQTVAQFVSLELKAPRGRVSPEQRAWAETVAGHGGIAGVVGSVEEAEAMLGLTAPRPEKSRRG